MSLNKCTSRPISALMLWWLRSKSGDSVLLYVRTHFSLCNESRLPLSPLNPAFSPSASAFQFESASVKCISISFIRDINHSIPGRQSIFMASILLKRSRRTSASMTFSKSIADQGSGFQVCKCLPCADLEHKLNLSKKTKGSVFLFS